MSWLLLYARRLRAYTARTLRGWAALLALVLIGGGLVLLANGLVAPGCCVLIVGVIGAWLGEVWVKPQGNDAYARRMRDILKAGADVNARRVVQQERLRRVRRDAIELQPPPYLAQRHREVCELIGALDRMEAGIDEPFDDLAVRVHAMHEGLRRCLEEMEGDPSDPYTLQLKSGVEEYLREAANARDALREGAERDWGRLGEVKPPAYWRERHLRLASIAGDYLAALRDFSTALDDRSDDAIRDAAATLSSRQRDMDASTRQYLRQIGDRYVGRC